MDANVLRAAGAGLLFVLIFISGFWLSWMGKPYHPLLINVHKWIGLAEFVFLIVTLIQVDRVMELDEIAWTAVAVTGLLFLVTIVAGGLQSTLHPAPVAIKIAHRVTPFLTLLSTAFTLLLLAPD